MYAALAKLCASQLYKLEVRNSRSVADHGQAMVVNMRVFSLDQRCCIIVFLFERNNEFLA
jgi:hypothetical protein